MRPPSTFHSPHCYSHFGFGREASFGSKIPRCYIHLEIILRIECIHFLEQAVHASAAAPAPLPLHLLSRERAAIFPLPALFFSSVGTFFSWQPVCSFSAPTLALESLDCGSVESLDCGSSSGWSFWSLLKLGPEEKVKIPCHVKKIPATKIWSNYETHSTIAGSPQCFQPTLVPTQFAPN